MSRRYDRRTTTFSPQGRLFQVEYAMEAISQAGSACGILATDGVVLAAEKRITSKLLDTKKGSEKMYKIDDHIGCAVAGITSDANILLNQARIYALRHRYRFQEPVMVDSLIRDICNVKQSYTQFGGLRPFGVSFLFAGCDKQNGFQLYQSDPSGNYGGWKATAIGANYQNAQSLLKEKYKVDEQPNLQDALLLAVQVMAKVMDTTTPSTEKMEFVTVTKNKDGEVEYRQLSDDELKVVLDRFKEQQEKEKAEKVKESAGDI